MAASLSRALVNIPAGVLSQSQPGKSSLVAKIFNGIFPKAQAEIFTDQGRPKAVAAILGVLLSLATVNAAFALRYVPFVAGQFSLGTAVVLMGWAGLSLLWCSLSSSCSITTS
jgi:hypothetical protein